MHVPSGIQSSTAALPCCQISGVGHPAGLHEGETYLTCASLHLSPMEPAAASRRHSSLSSHSPLISLSS